MSMVKKILILLLVTTQCSSTLSTNKKTNGSLIFQHETNKDNHDTTTKKKVYNVGNATEIIEFLIKPNDTKNNYEIIEGNMPIHSSEYYFEDEYKDDDLKIKRPSSRQNLANPISFPNNEYLDVINNENLASDYINDEVDNEQHIRQKNIAIKTKNSNGNLQNQSIIEDVPSFNRIENKYKSTDDTNNALQRQQYHPDNEYYDESHESESELIQKNKWPLFHHLPTFKSKTPDSLDIKSLSTEIGNFDTTILATTTPPPFIVAPEITIRIQSKQEKHINVSRTKVKLLPGEQLRSFIKDVYIRMPLAVVVDPSYESLEKTKILYNEALQGNNMNIKIVLVTLNDSGIPTAFSFNNTNEFLNGLNSTKEHESGNVFIGVLHAAELVPYDSAVFLSTASLPPYTELVQDAAIILLKKRIRLFLLWYGERSLNDNETVEALGGIAGDVAIRSGGEIIHIIGNEYTQKIEGNTFTLISGVYRGSQEIEVPVDPKMSGIHIDIDTPMEYSTLDTPHGEINVKKLVKFNSQSEQDNKGGLDAYVPLNKLRKATILTLKLKPNFDEVYNDYKVFVRAERKADLLLSDVIKRFESYFPDNSQAYPVRLRNFNSVAKVSPLFERIQFKDDHSRRGNEDDKPKEDVETFSEFEIYKDTNIAKYNQSDISKIQIGNQYFGLKLFQFCGTKIEMNPQSQLLIVPGSTGQLIYEVTNMHPLPISYNIQVTDERRFLLRLTPQRIILQPYQTGTVSVTVLIPEGTGQGIIDRITFTTHASETSSLSLNLKVVTTIETQDTIAPSVSWQFGSRCDHINSIRCAEHFWNLDITAQDLESGILRLQTIPGKGLYYRNSYTVGSTDPIKATYIATCCEPKVSLLVYDSAGNQRSYNLDVRDLMLTDAAIAAITLGAILLLLLIILVVAGIIWCCRRRKISLELPTYRSHSTRSME